jgi:3-oxoadipate enol-lactonase
MAGDVDWFETHDRLLRYRYRPGRHPALVLIHEMGGSVESWDLVLRHIDPAQCVVVPEMRGMGLSERVIGPFTFADIASDIAALLDHLGIGDPVVLSGCAVGGAIALRFALDYPERSAGCVPLDPALDVAAEARTGLMALADRMTREGMRALEGALLDRTYPAQYRLRDPGHFARVRARWLANDPVSFAWFFRALVDTEMLGEISDLRCPVHLGAGRNDILRPPAYVRRVAAAIPASEVTELDAGHHVADHAPAAVVAILTAILDKARRGAAGLP